MLEILLSPWLLKLFWLISILCFIGAIFVKNEKTSRVLFVSSVVSLVVPFATVYLMVLLRAIYLIKNQS